MNSKLFFGLALGVISASALLFSACDDTTNTTIIENPSNDAQITSFSVASEDYSNLASTSFSIINKPGDYRIFNIDSIAVDTEIKSLAVSLGFSSSNYTVELVYREKADPTKDSIPETAWNQTDSVKFIKVDDESSRYYPNFLVTAPSGETRRYWVNFNIHKIDPDTIEWQSLGRNFDLLILGENKTILSGDGTKFCSLTNDGTNVYFYTSTLSKSTSSWENLAQTNLPADVMVKSLMQVGDQLITASNSGSLYIADINSPATWTEYNQNYIVNIIGLLPTTDGSINDDELTVLAKDNAGDIRFARIKLTDPATIVNHYNIKDKEDNIISTDFPINSYSALSTQGLGKEYLMITGGKDANGKVSNRTWIINEISDTEIFVGKGSGDNYTKYENGVSTFIYDKLPRMIANDSIVYKSFGYGDTWERVNSKQNLAPMITINGRYEPSVVVDSENYIWIFGGRLTNKGYTKDVWKGRLNKLAYLD